MGRAKLNMELITKDRPRIATYKKRKSGLIKKLSEFTTLCDVKACMIIYGPKQDGGAAEPEIWPENPEEVRRIIEIYEAKSKDSGNKTFGLPDFFQERKKKFKDELDKLNKRSMEAKYPTWFDFMNFLTESQLRDFAAALTNKIEYVKSRIEFLRNDGNNGGLFDVGLMDSSPFYPPEIRGNEFEMINQEFRPFEMNLPIIFSGADHHHQQDVENTMMMLLMNENSNNVDDHCLPIVGSSSSSSSTASTSGNFQFRHHHHHQVFYEST
ncbi:hypothetical protein M569_12731, partial [Genlisea aurea]